MKKKLLLLTLLASTFIAEAQNVGIGTSMPQATLDVKGNQRVGGAMHFTTYDSVGGKIEWRNSNLYVPVSQYLMQHSAAADGLYYNNSGGINGQLEYRNALGNPVFYTNFINGNGYFKGRLGISTINPLAGLHVADSSVLFSSEGDIPGIQGLLPKEGPGRRMMWYPVKAAFRAGYVNGSQWDNANIGTYSMATGFGTTASQGYSTAMGFFTVATGVASAALGNQTTAKALGSVSIGSLNDFTDNPDPLNPNPTDRIFQIGNGFGFFPGNAMTVMRSGNVGIGTTNPAFKLDVRNGSINADEVYRIGTITVLAVPGTGNLFVGKYAGRMNTGFGNTFSGNQTGYYNTLGSHNSFFGHDAGFFNTIGSENSFFGEDAGYNNTEGSENSFFGEGAGFFTTTGYNNTANGHSSLKFNTTGAYNTAVGHSADVGNGALTNATAIGAFATVNCSNCLVLGSVGGALPVVNVGIGTAAPGFLLEVNGSAGKPGGGAWAATSDARMKENIMPYIDGLSTLLKINPVKYHYNQLSGYDTKPEYVGVLAQDIKLIAPYMTGSFKKNGETYLNVDNSAMIYMLINAVKEQQLIIEKQQQQIDELKKMVEKLLKQ